VYGGFRNISSDGSAAPTAPEQPVACDHYRSLLQGNFIGMHATVLYRRAVLNQLGGFNERLPACEDYEVYLRIARHCSVRGYAQVVAEYRQHDTNMSKDHAFMLRSVRAVLEMEREWLPDRGHRQALRAGMHVWQDYYGAHLVEDWKRDRSLKGFLRMLRLHPRGALKWAAHAAYTRFRQLFRRTTVDFGTLRHLEPLSRQFGFDRGQPVDRYYIESFLAENAAAVCGRVLEIGDDSYSRHFGGKNITRQDVLHVTAGQPGATIIADLSYAPQIPPGIFDCIILTQTMQYIFAVQAAAGTLHRILRPGGVVLATLPGIGQICRDQSDKESDCWRFTGASARRLFVQRFGDENVRVKTYGNVLAATAFLHGLAAHELNRAELDHRDPDYQMTIAVVARKARATRETR
jgi:SAM-dependent methyltransferase